MSDKPTPMTVQDARLAKVRLEGAIADLLQGFTNLTGLKVESVYVEQIGTFEGPPLYRTQLYQVEVEAQL